MSSIEKEVSLSRRFVIACPARSGFYFLRDLLNQHPQIACYKEIYGYARDGMPKYGIPSCCCDLYDFIGDCFDKMLEVEDGMVGMKVPYFLKGHDASRAWDYIADNDIKIIFLERTNSWLRYISSMLGGLNGFHNCEYEKKCTPSIYRYLKETQAIRYGKERTEFTTGHCDSMSIRYEHLSDDIQRVLNRIYSFLGVDSFENTESRIVKQMSSDWRNHVTNRHWLEHKAELMLNSPGVPNLLKEDLKWVIGDRDIRKIY
jgi:hypothetical protein